MLISQSIRIIMSFKRIFLLLNLFFLSFSCSNNENKSFVDRKNIIKKSIVVGDDKFDGPEKFMYYHAAIKHGDIDISKPSIHDQYKPGYKEIELNLNVG